MVFHSITVKAHDLSAHEGSVENPNPVESLGLSVESDGRHGLDSQVSLCMCDAYWWWFMVCLLRLSINLVL